jgi:hypothetical protein
MRLEDLKDEVEILNGIEKKYGGLDAEQKKHWCQSMATIRAIENKR